MVRPRIAIPATASGGKSFAKKTKTIVYQNIIFIMFIKVIFLVLGADAIIGMKEAIFADMGVALMAIFNSMRILKTIEEKPKKDSFCSYKKS